MTSALQISYDISTTGFQWYQRYRSPMTSTLQFSNIPNVIGFRWQQCRSPMSQCYISLMTSDSEPLSPTASSIQFSNHIITTGLQQQRCYSSSTTYTVQFSKTTGTKALQRHHSRFSSHISATVVQLHQHNNFLSGWTYSLLLGFCNYMST